MACITLVGQVVIAAPDMVARCADMARLIQWRHLGLLDGRAIEQFEHGCGMDDREVLTTRIGPEIGIRTRHIDVARRDQCDQFMLVDRQVLFAATVLGESIGEPMGETLGDAGDRFAELPP